MAAKFFTGLPLDGPDPECVKGFGEAALAQLPEVDLPRPSPDHSARVGTAAVRVAIGRRPPAGHLPDRACDEDPLAGFVPSAYPTSS